MDNDNCKGMSGADTPKSALKVSAGRRKLLRGGLGAAPVLATFVSQPVHATYTCKSASAYTSANASRPGVSQCSGCSGAWWSANTNSWPTGCTPNSTRFDTYFSATAAYPAGTTLSNVLGRTTTADSDKLARNMVAALMNIKSGRIGAGVFDEAALKTIWTSAISTGYVPSAGAAAWNCAAVNQWLNSVFPCEV